MLKENPKQILKLLNRIGLEKGIWDKYVEKYEEERADALFLDEVRKKARRVLEDAKKKWRAFVSRFRSTIIKIGYLMRPYLIIVIK